MTYDPWRAYKMMYLIRRIEEEIADRYDQGKMRCPVHLSIGQESVAVGVMMSIPEDAHVFASHRSHAPYLAKGGDLYKMIAELHGKEDGCTGGYGGSMYLSDHDAGFIGSFAIVGDCISVATGAALAFKMDGSERIAVAYFGDAAVETGQFWESVNFATTHKLPILYVCENNLYATQTHINARQPSTLIQPRLRDWPRLATGSTGDSTDAVYEITQELLGHLPAFLEVHTYRYREHVGPNYDWDIGYRTESEVKVLMKCDPLINLESKLNNEDCDRAAGMRIIVEAMVAESFSGRVGGRTRRLLGAVNMLVGSTFEEIEERDEAL